MVDKLTMDLKQKFKEEDNCIQVALSNLQAVDKSNLSEALKKVQRYTLNEKKTKPIEKKRENKSGEEENGDEEDNREFEDCDEEERKVPMELSERLKLKTEKEAVPEWFAFTSMYRIRLKSWRGSP